MASSPETIVSMEDVYNSISGQDRLEDVALGRVESNPIPTFGHIEDAVPRDETSVKSLDHIDVSKTISDVINPNHDEHVPLKNITSDSTPNLDGAVAQKQETSSLKPTSQTPPHDDTHYDLTPHEKDILDRQLSLEEVKIGFFGLFRYATTVDKIVLGISVLAAIAGGAVIPLMTVGFMACPLFIF